MAGRQLGSDDDVFTRHTGFADSAAHHAFVLIVEGGIDESVALMNGRLDGVHTGQAVNLIGAESGGGQLKAAVGLAIGRTQVT